MTINDYQKQILTKYAITKPLDQDYMLVEDRNRTHGIRNKDMCKYKNNLDIVILKNWPPCSPDFNVIENIWQLLKQQLKSHEAILNVKDLKIALPGKWE